MKRIVLCADDYGQAPNITEAIIQLISAGRISATSCLVNTEFWSESAHMIRPYRGEIDLGLHFNLTEGPALSEQFRACYGEQLFSLKVLMAKSSLRWLDQSVIEAELEAQLDAFVKHAGKAPDYIDGHQHVHQFPVVREALLQVHARRLGQEVYLRSVQPRLQIAKPGQLLKKSIISLMGANVFRRLLDEKSLRANASFSGIYDFAQAAQYRQYFKQFLAEITDGGIIMTHPGLSNGSQNDLIAAARSQEFDYLMSPEFLQDCRQNQVSIARL